MKDDLSPGTFLLAEDSEADVHLLKRAFAEVGATLPLVVVGNGQDALDYILGRASYADRIRHPAPTVLLLDLKLPKKTGLEVLECLQHERIKNPKVIVMSSSEEPLDVRRAYELGATAFIPKPMSLGILRKIAKGLVQFWKDPEGGLDGVLGWHVRQPG